jgi:mRNA interferase MazF
MVSQTVRRFEVWLAALDPTLGREIQKTRPCVIVSPDEMNQHLGTVLAAPMTTGGRPAGFRVAVSFQGKNGLILPDQLRALDKSRLIKKLGRLDATTSSRLVSVLQEMFA